MALAGNGSYGMIDERFTTDYISREAHLLIMYLGNHKIGSYGYQKWKESPRDKRIIDYWGLGRNHQ